MSFILASRVILGEDGGTGSLLPGCSQHESHSYSLILAVFLISSDLAVAEMGPALHQSLVTILA